MLGWGGVLVQLIIIFFYHIYHLISETGKKMEIVSSSHAQKKNRRKLQLWDKRFHFQLVVTIATVLRVIVEHKVI